jgi:hypothetical protein
MVRRNISFAEVEDPSFREFVFCLNNGIQLMSRTSVRGDILKRYKNGKPASIKRLSRLSGGVCVSVDGWTSESQRRRIGALARGDGARRTLIKNNYKQTVRCIPASCGKSLSSPAYEEEEKQEEEKQGPPPLDGLRLLHPECPDWQNLYCR